MKELSKIETEVPLAIIKSYHGGRNSTLVVIPKAAGVKKGEKFLVLKDVVTGRIIFEPVKSLGNVNLLTRHALASSKER